MSQEKKAFGQKIVLLIGGLFALSPWASSALALFLGVFIAVTIGNSFKSLTSKISHQLLVYSVIGLGAGMNLQKVAAAGLNGIGFTAVSLSVTLLLGWLLGRSLKIENDTNWLISFGTAICGGSAIAALAPVLKAKPHSITVSLGVIFMLNSLALILFPPLGHWLGFSESKFGLWAALAVHDTSSVVGTGLQYGPIALQVGTTVKLARALWIVPCTFIFSYFLHRVSKKTNPGEQRKITKPWFILGFLVCAAIFTWAPSLQPVGSFIDELSRKGLVLTLFLIGANLTRDSLKEVGFKPLLQGVLLWIFVASLSAYLILNTSLI